MTEGRIAHYGVEEADGKLGVLKTLIYVACIGIEIPGYRRSRGVQLHGHETGIEVLGTEADKIADPRRRFEDAKRLFGTETKPGKPLIHPPDDVFRRVMRVLGGTTGRRILVRGKQALQFLILGSPLRISGIESLRQPSPSNITDQNFLLFGRGQFRAVGLELFEQADGGDVVGILCFRAAVTQPVFGSYPIILRLMSMPMLSRISVSVIPRLLASHAVSLFRAFASFSCCQ